MTRPGAMVPAKRCAADSMPPLRLKVLGDVAEHQWSSTRDVVKRLQLPRKTVDRVLQELHLLGLLIVDEQPYGESVRWIYALADDVNADALTALTKLARNVTTPDKVVPGPEDRGSTATCNGCGQRLMLRSAGRDQCCEACRIAAERAAS